MPASLPSLITTLPRLRSRVAAWRAAGETIALVPTMGALHEGHLALVRAAQARADRVVVSIFVNPTQFAPHEDFASYPRTLPQDRAALAPLSVDAIWAPSAAVMYPDGFSTALAVSGPALAGLEDKFRPHFFGGVATVVAKLFLQVAPDIALFGEKDYQQLKVVTRMAADLDLPLKVIGVPTRREKDGLARSSRNVYLSAAERAAAPALHAALQDCAAAIRAGVSPARALGAARRAITRAGFVIDYVEARDAETLAPVKMRGKARLRLLVAARLGKTRLIDNIAV